MYNFMNWMVSYFRKIRGKEATAKQQLYIIVFSAIDMGSFYKQGRSLKMTLPNVF